MLEHVLNLIKKDRLDEAIEFIKKNPIVKVKESGVFKGDIKTYNDPIVLGDRIVFSTCWKEGDKNYGAVYVLDKNLSLIKKFEGQGLCKAVEYANGKIYAGFDYTLYEFDLSLNALRKRVFLGGGISDIKHYNGKLIISSGFTWRILNKERGKLYILDKAFNSKSSKTLPYYLEPIAVVNNEVFVGGFKEIGKDSWRSKIYGFYNCNVTRESDELEGSIYYISPFRGRILAGFGWDFDGLALFDENLNVVFRKTFAPATHIKIFEDYVLVSGARNFYILDNMLNEVFKDNFNANDFIFKSFALDNLRIYAALDSNQERWESKIVVLDFLLPLKKRIEKLLNLKNTPVYHQAKSLLLQLKLKEFDEFVRNPVTAPISKLFREEEIIYQQDKTPTKIPAKIDVKAPSEIKWNSCGTLTVEVVPESSTEGLTLDLSDLTRFFEVLHNRKPVTSIDFPPLRKGIKIVEEVKLIPKYKGEFKAELTFRWKNLRKSIPMEITVKSIQHEFPIPKYEPVKLIGEGLTSYVWMCKKDGSLVAVKIPKEEFGKEFIDELANWKRLNHLNIVELYDYNTYPNPYAEMELCDCSLSDVKVDSLELATTLAKVLDYAHNEGVIHGDLKPSNILLKNSVIKVCDWGMGFTPAYAPPEVLEGNEPDEKADIWSYGVVLYEHITGENPFQGKDDVETRKKVIKVEPVFSGLSSLKSVVEKCLRKDPNERYNSFSEIKRELASTTISIYSKRFTMSRGKERLSNLITLVSSYELSGDVKTAKERIYDGMEIIRDERSRRILEAVKILIEIREECLKSIYKDKTIEAELIWMKFENLLSCLDDRLRQIIENDPYAGEMIKYIKMVSVNRLTRDELKKLYNIVCERIMCLLTQY